MAVHLRWCLSVLLLIVAISAVSSAPKQEQTAHKQAGVTGPAAGGAGGQARVQDPKCLQPKEPGPCRMNLERYYYNAQTNSCEVFKFGGCRGNDNKFGFLKTCEDACVIPKITTNNNAKAPATATTPAAASAVVKNSKAATIATNQTPKHKQSKR